MVVIAYSRTSHNCLYPVPYLNANSDFSISIQHIFLVKNIIHSAVVVAFSPTTIFGDLRVLGVAKSRLLKCQINNWETICPPLGSSLPNDTEHPPCRPPTQHDKESGPIMNKLFIQYHYSFCLSEFITRATFTISRSMYLMVSCSLSKKLMNFSIHLIPKRSNFDPSVGKLLEIPWNVMWKQQMSLNLHFLVFVRFGHCCSFFSVRCTRSLDIYDVHFGGCKIPRNMILRRHSR